MMFYLRWKNKFRKGGEMVSPFRYLDMEFFMSPRFLRQDVKNISFSLEDPKY